MGKAEFCVKTFIIKNMISFVFIHNHMAAGGGFAPDGEIGVCGGATWSVHSGAHSGAQTAVHICWCTSLVYCKLYQMVAAII